jgi:hypothetical protein
LSFRARPESLRANLLVMFGIGVAASLIACVITARQQRVDAAK